jgi:phosphoglycolate phosphatase
LSFKAAIFDLDGTLLDTLAEIGDSMNGVLDGLGFPRHDLAAYRYLTGEGVVSLITNALPAEARDGATLRRAGAMLREEYLKNWAKKTRLYAGVPWMLDALTRKQVSLNILSNKMDEFTQKAVAQFLDRWMFDTVLGETPEFRRKPDPEAALHIATRLGLAPADIVYLGDTSTDMATAAAAGMFGVGALWGFRDEAELRSSGARAVIAHPPEFVSFFTNGKDKD